MKLNLLRILSEEIKEQGFGRYYADITLPSGKKVGDIEGFDFEKMTTIDKKEIPFGKTDVISTQTDETLMGDDLLSEKIVIDAESSLGTKYCWGGVDPEGGLDCSGFIWHFYKQNGVSIPRTAREQYKKAKKVTKEELRIGDLIYFENTQKSLPSGEASHVGFIHKIHPDGKIDMLHSGTSSGVSIVKDVLNNSYHKNHFLGFGRLLEDSPEKEVNPNLNIGGGSLDIENNSLSKEESENILSKTKNYIIGDSQVPYIDNATTKAKRIKKSGGEESLWLGGQGVSWLKKSVDKYPVSKDVNSIIICIGTNGGFNVNDNISGLISSIVKKFPNAKLYAVKGSWGWGGNKTITDDQVKSYYNIFSNNGVTIINTPIGKVKDPHGNLSVYTKIGKEIDEKL